MKVKFIKWLKENRYILVSGGASLFIILLVYFCYGIIPFGDGTVYRMDLYHQYGPLFSELYDRITSGESLIYSWNTGIGSSFLGNFYNYLSSPIGLIILLFGHKNTFEAVAAMIAIKAVLSSMSMSYYLKKTQKSDGFPIAAFGIMYAFCGYFIAYYWNVMWIDAMYLLPFIAIGIEKIIESGKCKTYIIALALAIYSNYYIGFMLCIFSCIYFLYYYACTSKKLRDRKGLKTEKETFFTRLKNSFFLQSGIRFALSSLSVGILLAFMLVPLANILSASSATKGTAPTEYESYFTIFDFLANHLAALEPTIRSSGDDVLPNVYCGMLTVLLIPLYLFSKKINATEKIASVVLLAVMYFSFNINYLNFAWHGFHFPNDLPYRQSFMYSFILIVMAFKAFKHITEFSKKQILGLGICTLAFVVIVQELGSKNVDDMTVFITIAFTVLHIIVLGLITSKKAQAYALSVMVICSVAAETITANTDHYVANQSKTSFSSDYDDFKALQQEVSDNDDLLFYREELSDLRARMDPSWYDYNGASIFSSMAYEKVANMQKYIGLYGNKINSFTYNPQTPIYNAMFSLKYVYDKSSYVSECDYYTNVGSNDTFTAYENNYMLNLAYPVSSDLIDWNAVDCLNPVEAQQELFELATGVEGVFNRIVDFEIDYINLLNVDFDSILAGNLPLNRISSDSTSMATVQITANTTDNIYIYAYSRNLDTVNIYSPKITTTMTVSDGYILDLGQHDVGDIISVELPLADDKSSASVDFIAFTVDKDAFIEGYEKLKGGQLEYTEYDETLIEGNFTADEDEFLFTTIPYDKNWNIYLDGEKVSEEDIVIISEALIGVKVDQGEHEIRFEYKISNSVILITISGGFAILLIIFSILKKKKILIFKNTKENLWERTSKKQIATSETEKADANSAEQIIYFDE